MSKADQETTIQDLRDLAIKFKQDRNWSRHHKPASLAMSIAIEAAELMEHYQWEVNKPDKKAVAAELADIIIYCLHFAEATDIDIATAVKKKFADSAKKYPVEAFNTQGDLENYQKIKQSYRKDKGK